MDSYSLNWRKKQKSDQQLMLPAGESDAGGDDDSIGDGLGFNHAIGNGSSSIKIVRAAKDQALSQ